MQVGVIGMGAIGRAWTISFLRAGYRVQVWNKDPAQAEDALAIIRTMLPELAEFGLLNNRDPGQLLENASIRNTLKEAVEGAGYIQENTLEKVEVKREVFAEINAAAPPDAIMASSTSGIVPSSFTENSKWARTLHRGPSAQPPLPHSGGRRGSVTMDITVRHRADGAFLRSCGQTPITMKHEDPGFITIRLQGMMYHECWRLVKIGAGRARRYRRRHSRGAGASDGHSLVPSRRPISTHLADPGFCGSVRERSEGALSEGRAGRLVRRASR